MPYTNFTLANTNEASYPLANIYAFNNIPYLPELVGTEGVQFPLDSTYYNYYNHYHQFNALANACAFSNSNQEICTVYSYIRRFGGASTILGWDFVKR